MLESLIGGLVEALQPNALLYLTIGVVIGFIVGLLPGLGGAVTLALMIPFTFSLEPVSAFAFLLGMLAVTSLAGDLTAVLFGVPGEAISAALVLDGHPLAKQGRASYALGAAMASSLLGAIFGAFVLAAAIPIVRPVVLAFTSPEMFMLTILGVTFIAGVSEGNALRGLALAAAGFLVSTVGLDGRTGMPRFTFGQLGLWDGVGLVAVTVGLFGIPEIFDLLDRHRQEAPDAPVSQEDELWKGVWVTFQRWSLVLRGSFIGAFVGLLPGLGGSVSQWMAYAHAQQTSKEPELFGKGAIDGVIGPGAANNAKEGGSLIPTIAFGVPGSVTSAILLGALLIHGLTPGPSMLTTELTVTMSFIWILILANIVGVALTLVAMPLIVKVSKIRPGVIAGPIFWLLVLGAYAERNSVVDVVIMLAAGLVGLAMVRSGWPRAPFLLGLVLGPLAEGYLFRSVQRYGTQWLGRPLVMIMALLVLLALLVPVLRSKIRGQKDPPGPGASTGIQTDPPSGTLEQDEGARS